MQRLHFVWVMLICLLLGQSPLAQDKVDRLLDLLKQKGILSQQEVEGLKAELAEEPVEPEDGKQEKTVVTTVPSEKVPSPDDTAHSISVGERMKLSGDLRLRYDMESITQESASWDRHRGRYRLRFGLEAQPTTTTKVGFRLASGNGLQNTTNQSFDGHGRGTAIFIDRVYGSWDPAKWFGIIGGKHKNPFYTTSLVWDNDVNLQGVSEVFKYKGEDTQLTGTLTQFLVEEINDRTGRNADPMMLGFQAALKSNTSNRTSLELAFSYYDFVNMNMIGPAGLGDEEEFVGYNNRTGQQMVFDQTGRLLNEWDTLEMVGKFTVKDAIRSQPLSIFGTFIRNTSANVGKLRNEGVAIPGSDPAGLLAYGDDNRDKGYLLGAELGFNEKQGDFHLEYIYQVLEDFAFPAVFVDSDFHGGGTNNRGHRATVNYFVRDNIELQGIFYFTKRDLEAKDGRLDDNRVQLDVIFAF